MTTRATLTAALATLALTACGAPPEPDTAPRLVVAPDAADATVAAVELWARATDGQYAPEVVISEDCPKRVPVGSVVWCVRMVDAITLCNPNAGSDPYGCTHGTTRGVVELSRTVPADCLVGVAAHEIGHTLGLQHDDAPAGDLMDPHRGNAVRAQPCVSAKTTALVGMPGPGACLLSEH